MIVIPSAGYGQATESSVYHIPRSMVSGELVFYICGNGDGTLSAYLLFNNSF